jgi:hypothetical protein
MTSPPYFPAGSGPPAAEPANPGCRPPPAAAGFRRYDGNLFILFCRSQAALAALNDGERGPRRPGDIVR